MIDLFELDYREFEKLVGLLLIREGHQIVDGPAERGTRGADFEILTSENQLVLVEVKHHRGPIGRHALRQLAGDIDRLQQQRSDVRGLLVSSGAYTSAQLAELKSQFANLDVWDGHKLKALLEKHPDVERLFGAAILSQIDFQSQVQKLKTQDSRATELTQRMKALPCGQNDWREYERICTEILTYVFSPDLAAPDIQSRTDDKLDIIDAIFPIRSSASPWALVRSEYRSRFVVAEFKNYCDPIGQKQVESLAQYLWKPAQRFFGLLISRKGPGTSALAQRRRKWLEEEKCIAFLNDGDLAEMLQLRHSSGEPFDVIDAQLEDFFRTLTP